MREDRQDCRLSRKHNRYDRPVKLVSGRNGEKNARNCRIYVYRFFYVCPRIIHIRADGKGDCGNHCYQSLIMRLDNAVDPTEGKRADKYGRAERRFYFFVTESSGKRCAEKKRRERDSEKFQLENFERAHRIPQRFDIPEEVLPAVQRYENEGKRREKSPPFILCQP